MAGKLAWLAKGRERSILELCEKHLAEIVETVEATKKAYEAFLEKDAKRLEEVYKEVFSKERKADELRGKFWRSFLLEFFTRLTGTR
jgi:Phosphate transport regulator (distant homolog of PhoU)